jgi:superfamily I DNA and/or RNA helicase
MLLIEILFQKIDKMNIQQHFEHLQELLQIEKEEDLQQYKELIQNLSLSERRKKGVSWYPIVVQKTGYTLGDRAFVTLERTSNLNAGNKFRPGQSVQLFTKTAHVNNPEKQGIIQWIRKNKMKIVLNSSSLPDWLNQGSIGVDLLFDDRTYQEMEKALNAVKNAKNGRIVELRNILVGKQEPTFEPITNPIVIPELNDSQNQAVNDIVAARDVAIIHGPPGTGKTTTITHAIKQLCKKESTVLVTAPSNSAVDLLTERLNDLGLNVLRVGNISRVDESLVRHTLEAQLTNHPDYKNIKKIRKDAGEMLRKALKLTKKNGWQNRQEMKASFKESNELKSWADQLEQSTIDQILANADVITCTLVSVTNKYVTKLKFQTVFIDEAAQALEPATWIPILRAKRVIFAGDPLQLPPTVKSRAAQKGGFGVTMMERGIEHLPSALLKIQYRMNEVIMNFSNQMFYENQLIADLSVRHKTLGQADGNHTPLEFIDTAGCGFNEVVNPEFKSRCNPDEYLVLREHLYLLTKNANQDELPSIGIISPYREQVVFMQKDIDIDAELEPYDITVNTIDGFQGQERDVIYISLVRSNDKSTIGFLSDYRRMNVAMTRAKQKLIIIGDSATIGNNKFYGKFLDYCEKHGVYRTAWEFMS